MINKIAIFSVVLSSTTNINSGKKDGNGGKDAFDKSNKPKISTIQ
jgi:hypothetical protein